MLNPKTIGNEFQSDVEFPPIRSTIKLKLLYDWTSKHLTGTSSNVGPKSLRGAAYFALIRPEGDILPLTSSCPDFPVHKYNDNYSTNNKS